MGKRNDFALWIPACNKHFELDSEPLLFQRPEDFDHIIPMLRYDAQVELFDGITHSPIIKEAENA